MLSTVALNFLTLNSSSGSSMAMSFFSLTWQDRRTLVGQLLGRQVGRLGRQYRPDVGQHAHLAGAARAAAAAGRRHEYALGSQRAEQRGAALDLVASLAVVDVYRHLAVVVDDAGRRAI